MLVCLDVDGTIDSDPQVFQTFCSALRAAGCQVAVLTGVKTDGPITPADVQAKQDYLKQLDFDAYDQLAVFPDDKDLPMAKAQWCKDHGAAVLLDNSRANLQAAQDICLCLLPWQTRMGSKADGRVKKAASVRVL